MYVLVLSQTVQTAGFDNTPQPQDAVFGKVIVENIVKGLVSIVPSASAGDGE